MGAHASRKLHTVLDNLEYVLSIELLAATQAIDFRAPLRPATGVAAAHRHVRELVAELAGDRYLRPELELLHDSVADGSLIAAVEAAAGTMA